MYHSLLRPLLFQMDAENAHHFAFRSLRAGLKIPGAKGLTKSVFKADNEGLEVEAFGLKFPNPIGLAAGFDKDAKLVDELACLGFGFIEIGTVTPRPQAGNPLPRLFRLPADRGLINRMGFNNGGAYEAAARLKKRKSQVIIGGNIGKNKDTPNENALEDYLLAYDALKDCVDYFVVNVSSPNTPNLRSLQEKEPLRQLLLALQEHNAKQDTPRPILLKIAPDLTEGQLEDILHIALETQLPGLIATNTTISREGLQTPTTRVESIGAGGLSGAPVRQRSTEVIRFLSENNGGKFDIIGVGGIFSGEDAQEKLAAGAKLVQVYTGFVYEGPAMIARLTKHLKRVAQ